MSALADKDSSVLPEALAVAKTIQDERYRASALNTLADKLPLELLPEALAVARTIQDEQYRASALCALADKLPQILSEALVAARAIHNQEYRTNALSALADKLPPELLPEALVAAGTIHYQRYRSIALSALASGLSQMPNVELFPLWQDTLHELSLRTRPNLLGDIEALILVIFALSGEAATVEIARAIVDVARWWK